MTPRIFSLIVMAAVGCALTAGVVGAQQPGAAPDPSVDVSPAEIQRMFDAYALVQAQDQLKLGDEQFPQFLTRFKALQETRRRGQAERARALQDLMRASRQDNVRRIDDMELRERLKALQDLDARTAADVKKAYDAVDQVLDLRQQVRFRVFEEMMERRKIELITRARQNSRPRIRR
jgi:hypothetical protein